MRKWEWGLGTEKGEQKKERKKVGMPNFIGCSSEREKKPRGKKESERAHLRLEGSLGNIYG